MPRNPLAIFLAFFLALLVALAVAAVLAPPVQALLAPLSVFPLHRILNRLATLGVILITAWLMVRYQLMSAATLGFLGPWPAFMRRVLAGLAAGLALMVVALVPLFLLDLRDFNERMALDMGDLAALFAKGLLSGVLVALIEETFFRGAMQGALTRQRALGWALFAVPAFYAAVHFFGRALRIPFEQVHAGSGFEVLGSYFVLFLDPAHIWDAFLALYFVGLLLAIVRHRTGDLAGSLGLHAGFVAVIAVFRKVSSPTAAFESGASSWDFLVGPFDGLLGLWIALLTALSCVGAWRLLRKA
jgi:membrane protease YdiL (CAAX protease family)